MYLLQLAAHVYSRYPGRNVSRYRGQYDVPGSESEKTRLFGFCLGTIESKLSYPLCCLSLLNCLDMSNNSLRAFRVMFWLSYAFYRFLDSVKLGFHLEYSRAGQSKPRPPIPEHMGIWWGFSTSSLIYLVCK